MIRGMVRGMIRGYGSQNSNFPPLLKSAHLKKRHSHIYILQQVYVHFRFPKCTPKSFKSTLTTQVSRGFTKENLVVDLPLWKMMEFVSWDYDIPTISGWIIIFRRSLGRFFYFKIEIRFTSQEIVNYFYVGQGRERERERYVYIYIGDISIAPTWRAVAADKRIWDRWCQEELDIRMLCIYHRDIF